MSAEDNTLRCSKCSEQDNHRRSIRYCGLTDQRCKQCCIKLLGSTAILNCPAHAIGLQATARRRLEQGLVDPQADTDTEEDSQLTLQMTQLRARSDRGRLPSLGQDESAEPQSPLPATSTSHVDPQVSRSRSRRRNSVEKPRPRSRSPSVQELPPAWSHSRSRARSRGFTEQSHARRPTPSRGSDRHGRSRSPTRSRSHKEARSRSPSRRDRLDRHDHHGSSRSRSRLNSSDYYRDRDSSNRRRSRSRSRSRSYDRYGSDSQHRDRSPAARSRRSANSGLGQSDQALHRRAAHGTSFDDQETLQQLLQEPVSKDYTHSARTDLAAASAAAAAPQNHWITGTSTSLTTQGDATMTHSELVGPTLALERYKLELQKQLRPFASCKELQTALDTLLHQRAKLCTTQEAVALSRIHGDIIAIAANDMEFATEYLKNVGLTTQQRGGLPAEAFNYKLPARDLQAFFLTQVKFPSPRPFSSRFNQLTSTKSTSSRRRDNRKRFSKHENSPEPNSSSAKAKSCANHPHSTSHSTAECNSTKKGSSTK